MTPTLVIAIAFADWSPPCENRPVLVEKIALREGYWKSGTLPERLNNPGSIKYVGQPGTSLGPRGFARYDSVLEGWEDLERLINRKRAASANFRKAWPYLRKRP